MERYAPSAKDLASRDVVSRAITMEINEGRGLGTSQGPHVPSIVAYSAAVLKERLPGISRNHHIRHCRCHQGPPYLFPHHYNMGGYSSQVERRGVEKRTGWVRLFPVLFGVWVGQRSYSRCQPVTEYSQLVVGLGCVWSCCFAHHSHYNLTPKYSHGRAYASRISRVESIENLDRLLET